MTSGNHSAKRWQFGTYGLLRTTAVCAVVIWAYTSDSVVGFFLGTGIWGVFCGASIPLRCDNERVRSAFGVLASMGGSAVATCLYAVAGSVIEWVADPIILADEGEVFLADVLILGPVLAVIGAAIGLVAWLHFWAYRIVVKCMLIKMVKASRSSAEESSSSDLLETSRDGHGPSSRKCPRQ